MASEETPTMSSSTVPKVLTRSVIEAMIVGGLDVALVCFGVAAVLISTLDGPFGVFFGALFILLGLIIVGRLVIRLAAIGTGAVAAMPRSLKK